VRTILLAGTAMLGATLVGAPLALAQTTTPSPDTALSGATPVKAPVVATSLQNFATNQPLVPGTFTVRLGGRLTVFADAVSDSGRNPGLVTLKSGDKPVQANTKLANYGIREYGRLYPSFDAVAANGLRYGAYLEIRADSAAPPGGGGSGSISGANNARGALYFYRETGYIGAPPFGYLRFGATDGPLALFATGENTNFNYGGWNGDKIGLTTNTVIAWPFADYPNEISTSKLEYLSPRFGNIFDFGVSFEPSTGTASATSGNCPYANTVAGPVVGTASSGTGCDATSSTSVAAETARRRNTVEANLRAIGAFGPVGVAATLGFAASGSVQYDGVPSSTVTHYDGLRFVDSGVQLTYGGLALGGHVIAGRVNGAWNLDPKGGRDALDWTAGGSYVIGPLIVGVQYVNFQSNGAWTPSAVATGRTRSERGVAVGGTLTLAPDLYLMVNYLYGQRHQAGVDLLTNVTNAKTHNNTQAQGVSAGLHLLW